MQHELDQLRVEIEELRAARRRLVLASDADRRAIERALHDGVHQHLVALAVALQLAGRAVDADPAAAQTLLDDMRRDVQRALDETALLAQRIYPATLELGGLGALLRAGAVNAGVPVTVDVAGGADCPPEVGMTVYLCWLAVLGRGSGESRVSVSVRQDEEALAFEMTGQAARAQDDLDAVQNRVEALGGRLKIEPEPDGGIRISGSLPVLR